MKTAVKAIYERDSRNYHLFLIETGKSITGRIYARKGEKVPDVVEVYLRTRGEEEKLKAPLSEKTERDMKRRNKFVPALPLPRAFSPVKVRVKPPAGEDST